MEEETENPSTKVMNQNDQSNKNYNNSDTSKLCRIVRRGR